MIADAALWQNVVLIGIAFALGGILKGAVGAGAPLLAVPMLALMYDVPTAITLFAIPNLVPNLWQVWQYRDASLPGPFRWRLVGAGSAGCVVGTIALANVQADHLLVVVASLVLVYVGFRLARPSWVLTYPVALRAVPWVAGVAGMMQTLGGISAPASLTFLNAMRLERRQFIVTISSFFVSIGILQVPLLVYLRLMTWELFAFGCGAVVVIFAFMPVGAALARRFSAQVFDRVILGILVLLALRMLAPLVLA